MDDRPEFPLAGELTAWQRSSQRAEIVGEAIPLFEGDSLAESRNQTIPVSRPAPMLPK